MARISLWMSGMAVLLCACQPGAPARVEAPADSATGEIPLEWAGPNDAALLVPVYINGTGPHSFVLDTGATLTCVDQALATELSLPEPTGQIGLGAGIGAGQVRLVRIDSLRVGTARAEELPSCALDLSTAEQLGIEFDGLLGLNFLRAFRLELDFERAVLTLQQP
jgi:predicted aspartyl protease